MPSRGLHWRLEARSLRPRNHPPTVWCPTSSRHSATHSHHVIHSARECLNVRTVLCNLREDLLERFGDSVIGEVTRPRSLPPRLLADACDLVVATSCAWVVVVAPSLPPAATVTCLAPRQQEGATVNSTSTPSRRSWPAASHVSAWTSSLLVSLPRQRRQRPCRLAASACAFDHGFVRRTKTLAAFWRGCRPLISASSPASASTPGSERPG